MFPRATSYRVPAAGQGSGIQPDRPASTLAAQSRRSLQQHGSGVLTASAEVPWYCQPGADALQVQAPPGSAVLFWDFVPVGADWRPGDLAQPDPTSLHGGCPVLAGQKLIATRWIRAADFS